MKRLFRRSLRAVVGLALGLVFLPAPADATRGGDHRRTVAPHAAAQAKKQNTEVVIRLGLVRNGAEAASSALGKTVRDVSRASFSALPGVRVLADETLEQQANGAPTVLVTAKVQQLSLKSAGSQLVYSAAVEYTLHRMPEQAIAATLRGRASVRTTAEDLRAPGRASALRASVLRAAMASAIRPATDALRAAAQH